MPSVISSTSSSWSYSSSEPSSSVTSAASVNTSSLDNTEVDTVTVTNTIIISSDLDNALPVLKEKRSNYGTKSSGISWRHPSKEFLSSIDRSRSSPVDWETKRKGKYIYVHPRSARRYTPPPPKRRSRSRSKAQGRQDGTPYDPYHLDFSSKAYKKRRRQRRRSSASLSPARDRSASPRGHRSADPSPPRKDKPFDPYHLDFSSKAYKKRRRRRGRSSQGPSPTRDRSASPRRHRSAEPSPPKEDKPFDPYHLDFSSKAYKKKRRQRRRGSQESSPTTNVEWEKKRRGKYPYVRPKHPRPYSPPPPTRRSRSRSRPREGGHVETRFDPYYLDVSSEKYKEFCRRCRQSIKKYSPNYPSPRGRHRGADLVPPKDDKPFDPYHLDFSSKAYKKRRSRRRRRSKEFSPTDDYSASRRRHRSADPLPPKEDTPYDPYHLDFSSKAYNERRSRRSRGSQDVSPTGDYSGSPGRY